MKWCVNDRYSLPSPNLLTKGDLQSKAFAFKLGHVLLFQVKINRWWNVCCALIQCHTHNQKIYIMNKWLVWTPVVGCFFFFSYLLPPPSPPPSPPLFLLHKTVLQPLCHNTNSPPLHSPLQKCYISYPLKSRVTRKSATVTFITEPSFYGALQELLFPTCSIQLSPFICICFIYVFFYMNICRAPHLQRHPKHFPVATI